VTGIGPLVTSLSPAGVTLIAAGGLLYSVGIVFHVWKRLPYNNAIWHVFVLAGAICHFAAVVGDVAVAYPAIEVARAAD
jgi:hemolysin III